MTTNQPVTQVLLHIEKAFQEEIITNSGLKLFLDSSYRKEHNVAVVATIVALPQKVSPKDKKIVSQLKEGDEIAISYQIVSDLEYKSDRLNFMPVTEDNPYAKEFVNGRGEWIRVYALKTPTGATTWVGCLQDKYREVISGVQGTQSDCERWMAQFTFGKTDVYSFNNFFEYNGKDYWKCNLDDIFAKRVKGQLVAVGDRVICKPIDIQVPKEKLPATLHHSDVKIRFQDRGRVITGGKEKGIKKDWIVSFNPNHCEKYEFFSKPYFLINQNLVNGTWQTAA